MRTFIAIEMPAEVKAALAALQQELRRAGADVSWTKPESLHLTLRFLGEVAESRLSEVAAACSAATEGFQPLTLRLQETGAFPNFRQPRVLWVGLAGEVETAGRLQAKLEELLVQAGCGREDKPFRPHLTIGRVKSNRQTRELAALAASCQLPELSFSVKEIVLLKSELHREGARYTPLAKAVLESGASISYHLAEAKSRPDRIDRMAQDGQDGDE